MEVQKRIEEKLRAALSPEHLEVVNESGMHAVPPGAESHFKVVVVTRAFEGQGLLARHREVNRLLAEELAGPVHALAVHAYTPAEWAARGGAPASPPCHGGGRN